MIPEAPSRAKQPRVVGEARWPMAVAVLAVIVLTLLLPHDLVTRPRWGVPLVEALLLVAVIIGDPGKIDRVSPRVRALSITLISLLVATALWCTAQLITELIRGGPATNSGGALLAAGGIVYISNCLAFGLLYWEPRFVDYLYLGFTSATAFSPTDVMPLRAWNKLAMMAQSTISLVLLGLVIARAVNVLK
jgi:hypothetical protein